MERTLEIKMLETAMKESDSWIPFQKDTLMAEVAYSEFAKGAYWMYEQMMKEAITADIDDFGVRMYEYCVEKLGLTSEDKVKLYIFKDDENN